MFNQINYTWFDMIKRITTHWLLTIAIVLGCQFVDNDGLARDPYTVGFPPCQGGGEGYPGIITATNRTTNQADTYLVLFAQPSADPAYWFVGTCMTPSTTPTQSISMPIRRHGYEYLSALWRLSLYRTLAAFRRRVSSLRQLWRHHR